MIERIVLDREPLEDAAEDDIANNDWNETITKDRQIADILNSLEELEWN